MSHKKNRLETKINHTTIPIKGMHCRSCEILVEDKLKAIDGVKEVLVNYRNKQAIIRSQFPVSMELIKDTIANAGYSVGIDEPKQFVSRDVNTWKRALVATALLIILYLVAKALGLFNIKIVDSNNPGSLAVVLLVGITAGFSSCMALVGGLVLAISAKFAEMHPSSTPLQKFRPHLFFNLGRILSYFILGGLIGLIGKGFQLSGGVLGGLLILVGIVMLIVGLQLTELFPGLARLNFSLPSSIGKAIGFKKHKTKEYSHLNSAISGGLTFFLPCGFTQSMQLFAMATGSFWSGAMIMAVFAIGTAPGLLGVGGATSAVKGPAARSFFQAAGILVIMLAIFNISNGLNLSGVISGIANAARKNPSVSSSHADSNITIENGVQIVNMQQNSDGYSPNKLTVKQGVPVKWVITSTDSSSCASSIYSQQLGIRKFLKSGENIIEFTPTKTGTISFSCSMGMYRGSFNVIK